MMIGDFNIIIYKAARITFKVRPKRKKVKRLPRYATKDCYRMYNEIKGMAKKMYSDPHNYAMRQSYYSTRNIFRLLCKRKEI